MQSSLYVANKLVEHKRDGLVEQEHYGFVELFLNGKFLEIGNSNNYPFYLRSCAKPLQASLMIDEGLDKILDLSLEEIAISCASHAGEGCHVDVLKAFLNKVGLSDSLIKCGLHKPLAKSVNCDEPTVFHNNCCGKHILMLVLSKYLGFDLASYDDINHPLQKMIKDKIFELCEYNDKSPTTKDGCGVPIFSMPLKNMLKGYLNLFLNNKYEKIKNAFLENPYLIGGEDRLDTIVMQNTKNCIAKVGAEGLCAVVNLESKEGFIVKISDSDMKTREFVVLDLLNKLGWAEIAIDDSIKTLRGEVVGKKKCLIKL